VSIRLSGAVVRHSPDASERVIVDSSEPHSQYSTPAAGCQVVRAASRSAHRTLVDTVV